ncbi:MAG: hypothetical protein AB8I08_29385 [Sandaracinaceae bacterium]
MRPAEARRLAKEHDVATLAAAAEALSEETEPSIEVRGEDHGERLTHCLLAQRIRGLVDGGAELKDAFREVMRGVRGVLQNEDE